MFILSYILKCNLEIITSNQNQKLEKLALTYISELQHINTFYNINMLYAAICVIIWSQFDC